MKNEKISVVIPTYTPDIKLLRKTLFSLMHQSVKPDQVIVVENGVQNDDTRLCVESFGFKYVYNEKVGANPARNVGANLCADGVLFFTDDDCELKYDCLEKHLDVHTKGNFLVGGKVKLKYLAPKPEWMCFCFESMLAELDWTPDSVLDGAVVDITNERSKYLVSANLSIRTNSFNEYGGFDNNDGYRGKKLLTANDEMMLLETCRLSNKTRLVFSSFCEVNHNIPKERLTEEYMHRRFYGQGIADSKSSVRSPHLKSLTHPVDLDDHCTIITNSLLKFIVGTDHYLKMSGKMLTGDKLIDREINRVFMTCYCKYIQGINDFLFNKVTN
jgi:glycosyltransferase involved in cell wall biosynthesis